MGSNPGMRRALIIGILGVLVILALDRLVPKNAAGKKETLVPLAKAVEQQKGAQKELEKLSEDERALEPQITAFSYNRQAEELTPRLIRRLQAIAQKAEVRLVEVKPQRTREIKAGGIERLPIEVRFRAPFQPNVMQFLYHVEDPKGKMVVEKLTVTSADPRTRAVDVAAQIAVFTRALTEQSAEEGASPNDNAQTQ